MRFPSLLFVKSFSFWYKKASQLHPWARIAAARTCSCHNALSRIIVPRGTEARTISSSARPGMQCRSVHARVIRGVMVRAVISTAAMYVSPARRALIALRQQTVTALANVATLTCSVIILISLPSPHLSLLFFCCFSFCLHGFPFTFIASLLE